MTDVERNSPDKWELLVQSVEGLASRERDGWLSTSQAAKLMSEQLGGGDGGSGEESSTEKKKKKWV